ncbi:DUF4174 domain-containing protein [Pseudomonas sp. H9]|uniref:DUF4174 domain-containing protein n=1 Tax=Pseudomonas sp. H9 TaxID=483968 RepID=UPI001057FC22|nr:DUF4174 domain-containing protein [Pseudomonas sp. H9]TDF82499.1 DUF4174 domain-containing protein [Pseudomonas sp. H9]
MLVRSLTLATLMAIAGPVLADESPLNQDLYKSRPLIVIAPSTADPTLRGLNEALKDPSTKKEFDDRGLVLYSVAAMVGKRDDKFLDQQATMALIRELSLGARNGTQVVLVGKDGQKHEIKHEGAVEPKSIFAAVDALPAEEKAIVAPTVAEKKQAEAKPAGDAKSGKPAKPAKPAAPPKPLED